MTPDDLRSMRAELEKAAAPMGILRQAGRFISRSPLRTTAVGAGVGGAAGAAQEHATGGSALEGGFRGAVGGAALGGAVGLGGRTFRDVRLLDPRLTTGQAVGATAKRLGKKVTDFGKRQIHGFTGAYGKRPGDIGLRSVETSKKQTELLRRRMEDELKHTKDPAARKALREGFAAESKSLEEVGRMGTESLEAGATSLPGLVRGAVNDPKRLAKAVWHETTGGPAAKTGPWYQRWGSRARIGGAVAVPAAAMAPEVLRGDESAEGGRTMGQKLMGLGTATAGGILTAGLPIVPMTAAAVGIDEAGARSVGALRRYGKTERKRLRELREAPVSRTPVGAS